MTRGESYRQGFIQRHVCAPRVLAGVVVLAMMTAGLVAGASAKGSAVLEGETTIPGPDFQFTTLSGDRLAKESLKGKPALLMFWATWCGICRAELPLIHELDVRAQSMGLQIVAVGFADSKDNVVEYVKANRSTFSFPTVYDTDNDVASQFRVRATPTFFLLDGNGDILLMHIGGGILQNTNFRRLVNALLT